MASYFGIWTRERVCRVSGMLILSYCGAVAIWWWLSRDGIDASGVPLGADFVQFYAASRFAVTGLAENVFSIEAMKQATDTLFPDNGNVFLWNYPPTFLLMVAPLGWASYGVAFSIFLAATGLVYLAAARRLVADRSWWLFALAFPGAFVTVLHGQTGFIGAAALGLGLSAVRDRPLIAGLWLGLGSYKPHLGLLIPFVLIAGGYWRAFMFATLFTLLFALASAVVLGLDVWRAFVLNLPIISEIAAQSPDLWPKMASVFAAARLLGASEKTAFLLHVSVAVFVLIVTMVGWSRPGELRFKVALAVCGSLLVTPYVMNYDFVLLAIPLALLTQPDASGRLPVPPSLLVMAAVSPFLFGLAAATSLPVVAPILWALFGAICLALLREGARLDARSRFAY